MQAAANSPQRATSNASRTLADTQSEFKTRASRIRDEIATLASSVAEAGENIAGDLKDGASAKAREMRDASEQTLRDLRTQLESIEKQAEDQVRRHPLSALAIAAGVGFLFAMLFRR